MIKRLFCVAAVVFFCVGSAAAWTAESFVGLDDPLYYDFAPVARSAVVSSFASGSSSGVTEVTSFDYSYNFALLRYYTVRYKSPLTGTYRIPQSDSVSSSGTISTASHHVNLSPSRVSFPAVESSSSQDVLGYDPTEVLSSSINLSVPIDNSDGATAIAIDLSFPLNSFSLSQLSSSSSWVTRTPELVELYVDDLLVRSYPSPPSWTLYESDIYFSSSSPIHSVSLRFRYPVFTVGTSDGSITLKSEYYFQAHSSLSYSLLSSDDVLNGWNDKAQDDLNKHEEYESQWVGSMTENFNNLNLSNFTFPVGLISGFDLLRGIFQDLWNVMGEYRIVYVFPLTLAVVLLLIGRLAKDTIKGPQRAPKDKGGGSRA